VSALILHEPFTGATLDSRLQWLNPPEHWRLDRSIPALIVEPSPNTDFWQRTHYGFRADNGHFFGLEVARDFCVSTEVSFHAVHQYDQAGLMIRSSPDCWVKTSVEHELDAPPQLGVVVTNNGYSDWSLQDLPLAGREICLRLRLRRGDVTAEFGGGPQNLWKPMRVAHLHRTSGSPLWCGLYACSPKGAGFRATFKYLRVEEAQEEQSAEISTAPL
jgi:regulation of enolase protein 1 (concanavalin A-like superfamily)